jgi:hypothetical protein
MTDELETKFCHKCQQDKLLIKFPKQRKNPTKRSSPCFRCRENSRLNNPNSVIKQTVLRRRGRYLSKDENVPAIILRSSKQSDKKYGRIGFDLDREFIAELIKNGCEYCTATEYRMTIDRIDNNLAHTKSNSKPSCVRCNHIRGSMPFEAWMNIVPVIRKTYELGLFGNWWVDTQKLNKPSSHLQATADDISSPSMNVTT